MVFFPGGLNWPDVENPFSGGVAETLVRKSKNADHD